MRKWEKLPHNMQNKEVRYYYDLLVQHKCSLFVKRIGDILFSLILLVVLMPVFLIISIMIKLDSSGPIIFKQERVTRYGKHFYIFKFRTMIENADKMGSQVTTNGDRRVTRVGKILRKVRLDELPQLLNIARGDMTFVGTRPEVVRYVECYNDLMLATLLLPAGVTSRASIEFKDEEKLLEAAENVDDVYVNQILPRKMEYNLNALENFGIFEDVKTIFYTVIAVLR